MGRPNGMVDASWTPVVSGVQYGVAGELLAMSWMGRYEEVRTYNTRLQLTQITAKDYGTTISRATYNFPAAPGNNGRIASESRYNFWPNENETINYSFDNWNRLTYAAGSGWTQSFSYDGFGNLTAKVGTGSAPSGSYPVNGSNNRLTGETYDANGNIVRAGWAYDYENRLMWGGGKYFLYDSSNRKVREKDPVTGYETITFYGVDGKWMATYGPVQRPSDWVFARGQLHAYFAGKRLAVEDRLGSSGNGRYFYPYGDPRNGGGPSAEFATYPQDTTLGLQYAINRWYLPGQGRFTTADPYRASGGPAEPGSWNRYSYVGSDQVGFNDPAGLQRWFITWAHRQCTGPSDDRYCFWRRGTEIFDDGEGVGGGGGGGSPGGEPGGGGPTRLLNGAVGPMLQSRVAHLRGSNCGTVLSGLGFNLDRLIGAGSHATNFFDYSAGGSRLDKPISSLIGASEYGDRSIGSVLGSYDAITVYNAAGNAFVIVGPNWFTNNAGTLSSERAMAELQRQENTLLHELLHTMGTMFGDNFFANLPQGVVFSGEIKGAVPSDFITRWLEKDCNPLQQADLKTR